MSAAVVHVEHFKHVPLTDVRESETNPRRHFDPKGLEDLTASVKAKGILVPLLVVARQNKAEDWFEIVAGARRYRAAKAAGLGQVPVIVRQLSAEEVLEAQVIENLQREDVHPLDEAKGYEALMAAPYRMDVQKIADKVGRSVKYIYDRVKLLALTKEAQELFWSGRITAGHAILLARLSAEAQQRCIGDVQADYLNGGLFEQEDGLYHHEVPSTHTDGVKVRSIREVQAWIDKNVRFDVTKAEPMLFPETVKTVQAAVEEEDKIIPITHDHHVTPEAKDGSRTYGPMSWKRADGEEKSKTCEYAVTGVIVVGPGRGDAFKVCIDKKKCLVHWKEFVKAAVARAKGEESTPAGKKAVAQAQKAEQRHNDAYEKMQRKRKAWEKLTPQIEEVVFERVKQLPTKADGVLADLLVKAVNRWNTRKTTVPRGKTADDLVRHLAGLVLAEEIRGYQAYDDFPKQAKVLGVDLSKILKAEAEVQSAPKGKKKGKAA